MPELPLKQFVNTNMLLFAEEIGKEPDVEKLHILIQTKTEEMQRKKQNIQKIIEREQQRAQIQQNKNPIIEKPIQEEPKKE